MQLLPSSGTGHRIPQERGQAPISIQPEESWLPSGLSPGSGFWLLEMKPAVAEKKMNSAGEASGFTLGTLCLQSQKPIPTPVRGASCWTPCWRVAVGHHGPALAGGWAKALPFRELFGAPAEPALALHSGP